jgi:hypothetical protein
MRNSVKKTVRVGYALFVKREKDGGYQRVEGLFMTKYLAEETARSRYPSHKFRVEGVKLDHARYSPSGNGRGDSLGRSEVRKQGGIATARGGQR